MRNLLIAIIFVTIVTRSMADELPKTTRTLDSIKATTSIFDYQSRYEKACELEGRGGQRGRYTGRHRGHTGQHAYDGLSAKRQESKIHREEAVGAKPTAVTDKEKNCKCKGESECTCPPYVCDAGNCKTSYVVIFGRKDCQVCRELWKIVSPMRKKGYIVFYVDAEAFPHVVKQFKMKIVPTTLVYDKERVVARFNGRVTDEKITKLLKTRIEQGIK